MTGAWRKCERSNMLLTRRATLAWRSDGTRSTVAAPADEEGWVAASGGSAMRDDSLVTAKAHLNDSVEELLDVIRNPEVLAAIGSVDRSNLAKYLTIAKLRLENAIAVVRSGDSDR